MPAGPPSFLLLWDRTRGQRPDHDRHRGDELAFPRISIRPTPTSRRCATSPTRTRSRSTPSRVSIPSIIMQMAARKEFGDKRDLPLRPATPCRCRTPTAWPQCSRASARSTCISPRCSFHLREIKDPRVRTILSTDDVMGGSTTFTMLSTTKKFREDNPITYKALLGALRDSDRLHQRGQEGRRADLPRLARRQGRNARRSMTPRSTIPATSSRWCRRTRSSTRSSCTRSARSKPVPNRGRICSSPRFTTCRAAAGEADVIAAAASAAALSAPPAGGRSPPSGRGCRWRAARASRSPC